MLSNLGVLGELGIAIISATAVAYLARLLRQPIILGYLLAGVIIGPAVLGIVSNSDAIKLMSELGIAFLLFLTGLEINLSRLKKTGAAAVTAGILQVAITFAVGYAAAVALGFAGNAPLYIGIALAFSSTMIVVKLLADKGELDTLHGRIILGILLVQDVIAIVVLTLLPSIGSLSFRLFPPLLFKGLLLFGAAAVAAKWALPRIFGIAAKSQELLFLSAVSWCLAFAFFSGALGYSLAIGAFLAGIALASSAYSLEIIARVKSLRDFFSTMFFVSLGMQLAFAKTSFSPLAIIVAVITFSAIVVIGNPIIVSALMGMLGYTRRTAILTGLSIAQISEFSLIVAYLGSSLGHIAAEVVTIVVAVAAVTIGITSYVIKYDNEIYKFFSGIRLVKAFLPQQQQKQQEAELEYSPHKKYDLILCGSDRIGHSILKVLLDMNNEISKPFVVVDFNPDIIKQLRAKKIPCIYGDMGDEEVLERLGLKQAEIIVSTVPSLQDNLLLLKKAKGNNSNDDNSENNGNNSENYPIASMAKRKPVVVVTANYIDEAFELYDAGADYVILPHFLGGEHIALLLETFTKDAASVIETRLRHMAELKHRKELGHEHPHNRPGAAISSPNRQHQKAV